MIDMSIIHTYNILLHTSSQANKTIEYVFGVAVDMIVEVSLAIEA